MKPEPIVSFTMRGDILVERGSNMEIINAGIVWLTGEQAREASLFGWAVIPQDRGMDRDLVRVIRR